MTKKPPVIEVTQVIPSASRSVIKGAAAGIALSVYGDEGDRVHI